MDIGPRREAAVSYATGARRQDSIDLHADYAFRLGGERRLASGHPDFGRVMAYQTPRQARVGLRFAF